MFAMYWMVVATPIRNLSSSMFQFNLYSIVDKKKNQIKSFIADMMVNLVDNSALLDK